MSHYTVGYHDNYNGLHEICEYADDAYHAIKQAEEDLTGFNSPHKAEYCIREDWMKYHIYWNDKIILKDLDQEDFEDIWSKMHWVYNKELNYVEVGEAILEEHSC